MRVEEGGKGTFWLELYLLSASGVQWNVLDIAGHIDKQGKLHKQYMSRVHDNLVS